MLLNWDRHDFTLFSLYKNPPANTNPCAVAASECIGCLTNRGEILCIDPTKDGAFEIWVRINKENYCYYLFRYDEATIEC